MEISLITFSSELNKQGAVENSHQILLSELKNISQYT